MLTDVQLNGKCVRFSSLKAFRWSQPPEKYQEFEVYCLMDFKKGKRKKLTGKAELWTITVHRISFQLCLYAQHSRRVVDLTNRSLNVFQMTKSCWLKNPLLWGKKKTNKQTKNQKTNLCRNNNNNNNKNLHFVILGAPHIEVSRKGNGKKLHASCTVQQNPVLNSNAQTAPVTCFLLCHYNSILKHLLQ